MYLSTTHHRSSYNGIINLVVEHVFMAFYFYSYYQNPKITLHRSECGFCNKGKGMQHNKLGNSTGRWRGSFPDFEQAWEAAKEIGQQLGVEPICCLRCKPDKELSRSKSAIRQRKRRLLKKASNSAL